MAGGPSVESRLNHCMSTPHGHEYGPHQIPLKGRVLQ
jgi:hypothetical protein